MSPLEPATQHASSREEAVSQTPSHSSNRWSKYVADVGHVFNATLRSSYANYLLPFVALGIVAGALSWNSAAVFVLNFLAIFPLASLLSYSTEELSSRVGQTVGGLINASFGNAVELIVGITALSRGEISIVQSSMVGSVLSGILLILGTCFFAAGYKQDTVSFDVSVTGIMSSLMVVSSASLIVPSVLYATSAPSKVSDSDDYILTLSRIASIILLILYLVYLYFHLISHASLFTQCEEENSETNELGPWAASLVLIAATVGVTVCSDYLVDSIDGVVETLHVSRAFIGLIIVPIVGNAGEYATTVSASMRKKLDLAIGVVVGSTLQIALLVTPFLVILGWAIKQPMSLRFNTFETTVFSLAVLVVNYLIQDGRTNYFAGALLVGTYAIIAIAFFVHPDIQQAVVVGNASEGEFSIIFDIVNTTG